MQIQENNQIKILKISDKLSLKFGEKTKFGKSIIPFINGKEYKQSAYLFALSFYEGLVFKVNLQTISVPYDLMNQGWLELFEKDLNLNKIKIHKNWIN